MSRVFKTHERLTVTANNTEAKYWSFKTRLFTVYFFIIWLAPFISFAYIAFTYIVYLIPPFAHIMNALQGRYMKISNLRIVFSIFLKWKAPIPPLNNKMNGMKFTPKNSFDFWTRVCQLNACMGNSNWTGWAWKNAFGMVLSVMAWPWFS